MISRRASRRTATTRWRPRALVQRDGAVARGGPRGARAATTPSSRPRAPSSRPPSSELEVEKARIETFHDVVAAFAAEVELDRLGPLLLSKLRGAAGARGGALYVADPIEIERGLALYETAAIDPATLPPRFTPDAVERELVRHLLLPLASSGRPLGVVTLLDPVSRDLATLQRMADAGAIALSNALALETARHRADVNRAVLETAHDAFIAVDADARITVWTPQAEALFGYTAKEARGAPIDELVVPERWHAAYRAEHDALLATRTETRRFHLPAVHRDGRRLTIEVSVSPLQVGDSWQINGFVRDIGDRVAQERAREAQRAVSQALAEAGAGEDVVPRLLEALGRSLHWPVAVHWVPDPLAGEPRRAAEWRDPHYDGRELPVSVSVPIGEGPTGFGSFEFWQQRRVPLDPSLSDALDSISELVAEVLERRRAEAETREAQGRVLRARLARAAHAADVDHRLPGADARGGGRRGPADEQRQLPRGDRAQRAAAAAARRRPAVRRPGRGRARSASSDAGSTSRRSCARRSRPAGRAAEQARRGARGRDRAPCPPFDGDGDRLAQVVDNLDHQRGQVHARRRPGDRPLRPARRIGVRSRCADTGVGIAADEQDRLFERFFRTKAATEASVQGIGLGLSIVRAIARGHGGEVACESEEGVGTTFTVELPHRAIHEVTRR